MAKKPRDGEKFARLTQSLLESEAVATLPGAAFKLLALLALGARPPGLDQRRDKGSNGAQAVTYTYARRFGFTSKDTVQRGLQALLERGLIIKTRDGWRSKSHFALYGVAWLPITHRDGQPLDTPERPTDAWRTWKTPARSCPISGQDKPIATEILRPDSRAQSCPMVGDDEALSSPILSVRGQLSSPIIGDTSRLLGTGSRHVSAHAPKSPPNPVSHSTAPNSKNRTSAKKSTQATEPLPAAERIRQAIAAGFSDDDIPRIAKVTAEEVKQARSRA